MAELRTPPPIQVLPPGLLGLLQIKNGGMNPQFMVENVQPTFELSEWYLRSKLEISGSAATGAIGAGNAGVVAFTTNQVNLNVPANEWWWVTDYWVSATLTAGSSLAQFGIGAFMNGLPGGFPLNGDQISVAALNAAYVRNRSPFWMPPSSQLAYYTMGAVLGAGISVGGTCRFTRVPV